MVLARELTKRYEELRRGTISQVLDCLQTREVKGEVTLLVEGAAGKKR